MRLLFLERDIDKTLRRMALEEEKNLTETVNDILWKGLKDYLKQTGTNERAHFYTLLSGVCASCGASPPCAAKAAIPCGLAVRKQHKMLFAASKFEKET